VGELHFGADVAVLPLDSFSTFVAYRGIVLLLKMVIFTNECKCYFMLVKSRLMTCKCIVSHTFLFPQIWCYETFHRFLNGLCSYYWSNMIKHNFRPSYLLYWYYHIHTYIHTYIYIMVHYINPIVISYLFVYMCASNKHLYNEWWEKYIKGYLNFFVAPIIFSLLLFISFLSYFII